MSTPIQKFIANKKRQKAIESGDLKDIILSTTETMTEQIMAKLTPEIMKKTEDMALAIVEKWTKGIKKGDKGDKGDIGLQGESIVGPKGDSITGQVGRTGEKGDPGKSIIGKEGKSGKDGSPDKPEDIIEKINTLEEKINPKTIRNFEKIIKTLSDSIREVRVKKTNGGGRGSGGYGNWITEAPSGDIDSSNTTFTLTNNPATQGRALILLFNGQVLEYGNQFSISGKTITTLFTPETGSYLFAMYMRS